MKAKSLLFFLAVIASMPLCVDAQGTVPTISSISPLSAFTGGTVTITGDNFSPTASSNIVFFGSVQASVTAASVTNLTVTVPAGALYGPVSATVNNLTGYSTQFFLPTFDGTGEIDSSTLGPQILLSTTNGPGRIVVADIDGDGKPDLIVANQYSGVLSIFRNISTNGILGPGSFDAPLVISMIQGTFGDPYNVAVADLDGDGKLDIIAVNADSGLLSIFRNQSSPGPLTTISFGPRQDYPGGNGMAGIAVGDLNGDGLPDIVTADSADNTMSIFQNTSTLGNISLAPRVPIASGANPQDVAIGDLDGDGYPDLAVANFNDSTVNLFRNLGAGGAITTNSFAASVNFSALPHMPSVRMGDIDGDGKLDLVITDYENGQVAVMRNTGTGPGITTNSFAAPVIFALNNRGHNTSLGDLDGDGKPDLAVATEIGDSLSLFHNASEPGTFDTNSLVGPVYYATGYNAWTPVICDLDGDGRPDVVLVNSYDGTISVYQNFNSVSEPPIVLSQPQDFDATPETNVTFSISVTGPQPVYYQWLFDGTNIDGATNASFNIDQVTETNLGVYSVVVSNQFGLVTSSNASLLMPPTLMTNFNGAITYWGSNITLNVTAWGSPPLNFQWLFNGSPIAGATNQSYALTNIQFSNAGLYSVVVSDSLGSVTNTPEQVVVEPANISLGFCPAITINGTVGYTYTIQRSSNLADTNSWVTLTNLTLTSPVQVWPDTSVNPTQGLYSKEFYRVLPGQ